MQPAQYWRENKTWKDWIGRKGTVIVSTFMQVVNPDQAIFKPFSYLLVDFGDERHGFMGAGHEEFSPGDQVVCVLRKLASSPPHGLIPYGIKVTRIEGASQQKRALKGKKNGIPLPKQATTKR